MTSLLQQFLSEARDLLQGISEKLLQLEKTPEDSDAMNELFRFVHTLKGNSGLFEFPEMTRVLHAAEDLLDAVRDSRETYSEALADCLLDAMDFVAMLCDDIEASGAIGATYAQDSARLTENLQQLNASRDHDRLNQQAATGETSGAFLRASTLTFGENVPTFMLADIPAKVRTQAYGLIAEGQTLHWVVYSPLEGCFFQGEDPFFQAQKTPELLWGRIVAREPWPKLEEMDAYRCVLDFHILTTATRATLDDYYRYMADRIAIEALSAADITLPIENSSAEALQHAGVRSTLGVEHTAALMALIADQRQILALPIDEAWQLGRMQAAGATLSGCLIAMGAVEKISQLDLALEQAIAEGSATPLLQWFDSELSHATLASIKEPVNAEASVEAPAETSASKVVTEGQGKNGARTATEPEGEVKFGRRAEDNVSGAKSLKVDQAKIDRLMNLIGEMVVSKNALPYLT